MAKKSTGMSLINNNNDITNTSYNNLIKSLDKRRIKTNDVNIYDSNELSNYINANIYSRRSINYFLTKEGLSILGLHTRQGKSLDEIASIIGVNVGTLKMWKQKYPQINQVLSYTREVLIAELESASIKTAKGYSVSLVRPQVIRVAIKNGEKIVGYDERIEYVVYEEHVKADVNAQRFLLQNIAPDRYKGDAKQIAETLNNEAVQNFLEMQKSIKQTLEQQQIEDLQNEGVVVIDAISDSK